MESKIKMIRRGGYTVLPNQILRDETLTLQAKGLFCMMASFPENWDFTVKGLATVAGCGRDKIRAALKNLEDAGYLLREQGHSETGQFAANLFILYDEKIAPLPENTATRKPLSENPTQINKERIKERRNKPPIKTAFKAPINWIIDGINSFIRGVNRIKVPDWVPIVGGKGFSIKEIPRLAAGGVLEKGQTGFLEGNGAEAVVPLENNRKWIHNVAQDMQRAGIGADDKVLAILLRMKELLEQLTGMRIYLYPDKLVGELAEPMDEGLAKIRAKKVRS